MLYNFSLAQGYLTVQIVESYMTVTMSAYGGLYIGTTVFEGLRYMECEDDLNAYMISIQRRIEIDENRGAVQCRPCFGIPAWECLLRPVDINYERAQVFEARASQGVELDELRAECRRLEEELGKALSRDEKEVVKEKTTDEGLKSQIEALEKSNQELKRQIEHLKDELDDAGIEHGREIAFKESELAKAREEIEKLKEANEDLEAKLLENAVIDQ